MVLCNLSLLNTNILPLGLFFIYLGIICSFFCLCDEKLHWIRATLPDLTGSVRGRSCQRLSCCFLTEELKIFGAGGKSLHVKSETLQKLHTEWCNTLLWTIKLLVLTKQVETKVQNSVETLSSAASLAVWRCDLISSALLYVITSVLFFSSWMGEEKIHSEPLSHPNHNNLIGF